MVNDASSSHFSIFHFFTTFSFFYSPHCSFLLITPSSLPLLPPRPSLLLVPPSFLFLFLPRPALSQSLHKRPFFIDFDESVTEQPTDGRMDGRTNGRTRPLIEMRGRIYKERNSLILLLFFAKRYGETDGETDGRLIEMRGRI